MDLAVIVQGTEYQLSWGNNNFWVMEWDGLGMAELHRMTERGPLQHGDNDRGFRLDPRFIPLKFGALASSRSGLWDLRSMLLEIFKPGSNPIILKLTLDNGDIRYIDTHYYGGMNMPSTDRRLGRHQIAGVILRAADPTFYDPVGRSLTIRLGASSTAGGMFVPTEVPFEIGGSGVQEGDTITYLGNWMAYPHIIRITGPITSCKIINLTTGEKLDFNGVTIEAGDHYDIDLRFGYKTVVDASGNNKIADLTGDSDLATWHLAPNPEAPGGYNAITVSGTAANDDTIIMISYYNRYIGV